MNRLPNIIIAGITKAGTTSLRQYLIDHPEVSGAKVKETFFWNRGDAIHQPDLQAYSDLFPESQTRWMLDNTPRYFHDLSAHCSNLKSHLGEDLKVILILREPKSRVFSFYKFKKRRLEIDQSSNFDNYVQRCLAASDEEKRASNELLAGVDEGRYDVPLRRWESAFGDNLKVVFFDQLKGDPQGCLADIAQWMNMDERFYDTYSFKTENQSVGFKHRGLHRAGMLAYKTLEPVLLANKGIRRTLTNAYYRLNGKPIEERMSVEAKTALDDFYSESLKSLATLDCIRESDYLPNWIKAS